MKKRVLKLMVFLAATVMAVVFRYAEVSGIASFACGYAAVMSMLGLLPLPSLLGFLIGGLLRSFSLFSAIASATAVAVLAVSSAITTRLKRKPTLALVLGACLLSQAPFVVFEAINGFSAVRISASVAMALIFTYVVYGAAFPFSSARRGNINELTRVFLLLCACVFSSGLTALGAELLLLLPVCLLVGYAFGKGAAVCTAVAFGAGSAFYASEPSFFALGAFVVAVSVIFISAPRPITATAAVMAFIVFKLYFMRSYVDLPAELALLTAGGAAYCLIPIKRLNAIKNAYGLGGRAFAGRLVAAEATARNARELERLGSVFGSMSRAIRGGISAVTAENVRVRLENTVCSGCERCDKSCLEPLCSAATEKKCVEATDVPELLSVGCPHSAKLISLASELAGRNALFERKRDENYRLREGVAQQLDCVSELLRKSAAMRALPPTFDAEKERVLIDELNACGVNVVEAAVVRGALDGVVLIVRGEPDEGTLLRAANAALKSSLKLDKSVRDGESGCYTLVLTENTVYDAVFSASVASKSPSACGDAHAFIRISDTKLMAALCDGMGSGKEAGRISEAAIELVESYYRAGFDDAFIIDNVNRFLCREGGESFTAFDILVCDLDSLERTIIKMGSPRSFIKSAEGVLGLDGNALPLGAVSEIAPYIRSDTASDGDTVIFVSDGVTDALGDEALSSLMLDTDDRNVKGFTDAVLGAALSRSGGVPKDDMTVIAVRVMRRI